MSLLRLAAKGTEIGVRLATRKQQEILDKADLPAGVSVEKQDSDIVFVGRALRRRYITDGNFRRQIR